MTVQEIFERVLVKSGQYLISAASIELNEANFLHLVREVVGIYNHYFPIDKYLFKEITATRQYHFTEANTPEGIPEAVIEIMPIRIFGVYPFFFRDYDRPRSFLDYKIEFPFLYRKPLLVVPVNAEYNLHVLYYHEIVQENCVNKVNTITDLDYNFFNLLTAKFLQAVGRARRAFTLEDLPIAVDAVDLVNDGERLEEKTMENIYNTSKFYLSW